MTAHVQTSAQWRDFYDQRDRGHWETLEGVAYKAGLSLGDILERWPAFVRRRDLVRILAHFELFKLIENIPGSVAELGVHYGAGLFTWAHLLETFCPGDRERRVYGFDHFEGYGDYAPEDGAADATVTARLGTMQSSKTMVEDLVELHTADALLPGVPRAVLKPGDIEKTAAEFAANTQGVRLSLLYFDIGAYAPTKAGLEHLYPLVVEGGVVAFNGLAATPWEGEARAFEEYFTGREHPRPRLRKFPYSNQPRAYFVKGDTA